MALLFWLAVGAFCIIIFYLGEKWRKEEKEELEKMSDFIEFVNIDGKNKVLIKKRSPSLELYAQKLEIPCFRYEQKTPYYRTITIGHASTTEYVDDSGLVRDGVLKTKVAYIKTNNNLLKESFNRFTLYVTPDLYNEFLETFENSKNYVTKKVSVQNHDTQYVIAIDIRASCFSSRDTYGYCKYLVYYIEKFYYALLQDLKSAEEIQKLCNWFNSCS